MLGTGEQASHQNQPAPVYGKEILIEISLIPALEQGAPCAPWP
ncbi:hypothetical protein ACO0LF_18670 [Undibacterium sp. Di27W]